MNDTNVVEIVDFDCRGCRLKKILWQRFYGSIGATSELRSHLLNVGLILGQQTTSIPEQRIMLICAMFRGYENC